MAEKFNPYDELGLDRDASKEDVQKAYRERASETHPDKPGGSSERFALVKLARDVLSSAKRRAKFDQTGRVEEADGDPDNIDAEARARVMEVINDIISGDHDIDPCTVDIVDIIRGELRKPIGALRERRKLAEKHRRLAQRLEKKFKRRSKGPNLLSRMAQTRADQEGERIIDIDKDIAIAERAVAFLDDYLFETENIDLSVAFAQMIYRG